MWCYQVLVTYHGGHLTPCSFQSNLVMHIFHHFTLTQPGSAFWDLFITTGIQFLSPNEQKCHIIPALLIVFLTTVSLRINMWNPCETLSEMYVKIKSEKVDIISHPFHIYFTIQNFTSMWNMHVKCLWKVCEKHVKIGH